MRLTDPRSYIGRREFIKGLGTSLLVPRRLSGQILSPIISGGGVQPLAFQIAGGNSIVNPFTRMSATKTGAALIFNWGDGSANTQSNSPSHSYATSQLYTMRVSSPDGYLGITQFIVSVPQGTGVSPYTGNGVVSPPGLPQFPASLPSFAAMTNLTYFASGDTWWSGNFPIPNMSIFPNLAHFDIQGNSFGGVVPLFNNPALLYLDWHIAFTATAQTLQSFSTSPLLQYIAAHGTNFANCPSFASNTALTLFDFGNGAFTGVTGSLPTFNALTLLQSFTIDNNTFTGTIPTFAACTALTYWSSSGHSFSSVTAGSWATQANLATLNLAGGSLTSAAVNQVLADLNTSLGLGGRVTCTVNLSGGSNGAPTGTGITNKATLISAGWTVTTN